MGVLAVQDRATKLASGEGRNRVQKSSSSKRMDGTFRLVALGILAIFVTAIILWLLWPIFLTRNPAGGGWRVAATQPSDRVSNLAATFSALFSGLAFAGVVVALLLQLIRLYRQDRQAAADRIIERWNDLTEHRECVYRHVLGKKHVPFPKEVSSQEPPGEKMTPDGSAVRMMNLFEEWAALEQGRRVDSKYLHRVLGIHAKWFWDNVFFEWSREAGKKDRDPQDLSLPLAACWEHVFKKASEELPAARYLHEKAGAILRNATKGFPDEWYRHRSGDTGTPDGG